MNKTCQNNEQHGIPYPDKLATFVQNPAFVNGFQKTIDSAKLDFSGKKPFYTTCNYVNGKCRNCIEGRVKYVNFNNNKIALCYPPLESIKHKCTIGIHVDIKLILKGPHFEASVIPFDEKNEKNEKNEKKEYVKKIEEPLPLWPNLNLNNTDELIDKKNIYAVMREKEKVAKEVVAKEVVAKEVVAKEVVAKEVVAKEIVAKEVVSKEVVSKEVVAKEVVSKEVVSKEVVSKEVVDNEKTLLQQIKYLQLENSFLKKENGQLSYDNKMLEKSYNKEVFINKYGHKYDEILDNLRNLNNRISDQFFETNYSEYVLV
jgi:hypothetical protein